MLIAETVEAIPGDAYPLVGNRGFPGTVFRVMALYDTLLSFNRATGFPAPPTDALHLGPLRIGFYGLMIGLGAFLAVRFFGIRLERARTGTRDDAARIATFALPAGVFASRIYHVATDWDAYSDRPLAALWFWEGGLGILGGIAGGVLVGVLVARRQGLSGSLALTAVTPALPLAQAFGRWGNWFNQELFGRPTTLPWGLEVHARKIPSGFPEGTLFHPTFLYESLGCLFLVGALLVIERRLPLRPGRLFLVYVCGYTLLRFPVESLRIDPAPVLLGLRLSQWVALLLFTVCSLLLVREVRTDRNGV